MDAITTHMSMHANNMWVAVPTSNVATEFGDGAWCRGIWACGGSGGASVPRSYGKGGGGGVPPLPRGSSGRAKMQVLRRLREHHTLGDDEEVSEWREGQARRRTEQRPGIVV